MKFSEEGPFFPQGPSPEPLSPKTSRDSGYRWSPMPLRRSKREGTSRHVNVIKRTKTFDKLHKTATPGERVGESHISLL